MNPTLAFDAYLNTEERNIHLIFRAYWLTFLPQYNNFISDPPLSAISKANQYRNLMAGIQTHVLLPLHISRFEGDEHWPSQIQMSLTQQAELMHFQLRQAEEREKSVVWLAHRKLVEDYSGITLAKRWNGMVTSATFTQEGMAQD